MILRQDAQVKHKLSLTLRNWLPVLQSGLNDLEKELEPFYESNPLINVKSGFEEQYEKKFPKKLLQSQFKTSKRDQIEALLTEDKNLFSVLHEQIIPPLFPTRRSEDIAFKIIENLDENGYFEGNSEHIAKELAVTTKEVEKVRLRFAHLDPVGIASRNVAESFLFQLEQAPCSDSVYESAQVLINDLSNMHVHTKLPCFEEAVRLIKGFKNPPAIEYFEESAQVIPDIYIYVDDNQNIEIKLNDAYYPTIEIDESYGVEHNFVQKKLKEAQNLVDALEMRKATVYKVGLMIVEYQYDFFMGGSIKPLTLKVLADEFGHNQSTISRAIANKYIECNRGLFPMKDFFSAAIEEDISNASIKEYMLELIKTEDRKKPYSDMKLLEIIQEKFKVKMVRRTISKYRLQLNIASSSERKKLYLLG